MKASTAVEAAKLETERVRLVAKLQDVKNRTKEFGEVIIKGEDGAERTTAVHFNYDKYPSLVKEVRKYIVELLEHDIAVIEAKIADL